METLLITSKKRPDGSRVVYSRVRQYAGQVPNASCFSIKYVLKGVENYRVNGHTYAVREQEFLLVNPQQSYEIDLVSRTPVLGLCLFLSHSLLHDAAHTLSCSDQRLLDNPFTADRPTYECCEMLYSVHDDALGLYLQHLAAQTDPLTGSIPVDAEELYYQVAARLLLSQRHLRGQLERIRAQRFATRQELLRRVSEGKRLIDSYLADEMPIAELAAASALSEFHFYRTFKQVFGISPHQYRLQQRLKWAARQLRERRHTIAEIACLSGFSDVQAFTKAFRKVVGVPPGEYARR